MSNSNQVSATTKNQKNGSFFIRFMKNHPTLTVFFIALIALAGVYLWKDIQGKNQQAKTEQSAREQLIVNQQQMLQLVAKPMAWSIRAEMLRGNMEQANLLISDLVKEQNMLFIHLVDPSGKVLLSSNKRFEGQPIGTEIDPVLLTVELPTVEFSNKNTFTVATPIMGVDRRLATLVFAYTHHSLVVQ